MNVFCQTVKKVKRKSKKSSLADMLIILISLLFSVIISPLFCTCRAVPLNSITPVGETTVNIWPLPSQFTSGNETLLLDPDVSLAVGGSGGSSVIVKEAFQRYRGIIFKHASRRNVVYNIKKIMIIVQSNNEEVCYSIWYDDDEDVCVCFDIFEWLFVVLLTASAWRGWELFIVSDEEWWSFYCWTS